VKIGESVGLNEGDLILKETPLDVRRESLTPLRGARETEARWRVCPVMCVVTLKRDESRMNPALLNAVTNRPDDAGNKC
jgi:hypothetical protein